MSNSIPNPPPGGCLIIILAVVAILSFMAFDFSYGTPVTLNCTVQGKHYVPAVSAHGFAPDGQGGVGPTNSSTDEKFTLVVVYDGHGHSIEVDVDEYTRAVVGEPLTLYRTKGYITGHLWPGRSR